jgi:hypothetical protein
MDAVVLPLWQEEEDERGHLNEGQAHNKVQTDRTKQNKILFLHCISRKEVLLIFFMSKNNTQNNHNNPAKKVESYKGKSVSTRARNMNMREGVQNPNNLDC